MNNERCEIDNFEHYLCSVEHSFNSVSNTLERIETNARIAEANFCARENKGEELERILRFERDTKETTDLILQCRWELNEAKKSLKITEEELKIIRRSSNPVASIYEAIPFWARIVAIVISPLSLISIWKLIFPNNDNLHSNKIEEKLPYRNWENSY